MVNRYSVASRLLTARQLRAKKLTARLLTVDCWQLTVDSRLLTARLLTARLLTARQLPLSTLFATAIAMNHSCCQPQWRQLTRRWLLWRLTSTMLRPVKILGITKETGELLFYVKWDTGVSAHSCHIAPFFKSVPLLRVFFDRLPLFSPLFCP